MCLLSNFCKSLVVLVLGGYSGCIELGRSTDEMTDEMNAKIRTKANKLKDAFDQFNRKYGEMLPDGTYQVPARWQAGLSNVGLTPNIIRTSLIETGCKCGRNHRSLHQWLRL